MSLSTDAVLVTLQVRVWNARKYSEKAALAVDMRFGSKGAGNYIKRIIDQPVLHAVRNIGQRARDYHYKKTLPWDDKVWRILPIDDFTKYSDTIRSLRGEFEESIDTFLREYRYIVGREEFRLQELWNEDDYPAESVVREKYGFSTGMRPIPETGDIRVNASKDEIAEMRRMMEEEEKVQQERATKEMHKRLYDTVTHISTVLSADNRRVRDALIEQAMNMCKSLEQMNKLIRDPEVDKMTKEVQNKIGMFTPDVLRADEAMREKAILTANDIASKMSALMG